MVSSGSNLSIPRGLVHKGIWTIPVSGLMGAAIYTYWMTTPDSESDLAGAAAWASSTSAIATGLLYVVAVSALVLGLLAVYSLLADGRFGSWALVGLVAGVLGASMILSAIGTFVFAASDVSNLYDDGDQGVGPAITVLSGGNFGPAMNLLFSVAILVSLIGALAFGGALWRSGRLPRWSAVIFGAGFVLFLSSTPVLAQVGGVLLAIAGVMIARSLGRREIVSAEPQPAESQRATAA